MTEGTLFIVFGPSGAGKTSLVKALVDKDASVELSVSYTTRAMRPGEAHGVDYFFTSVDDFKAMQARGDFVESAEVFGNYYGTSTAQMLARLEKGANVILEIDWQGAAQVRKQIEDCVSVCILPPSRESLLDRLSNRGQDSEEIIAGRMAEARKEISHYPEADFLVFNRDFDVALTRLMAIIAAGGNLNRCQHSRHKEIIEQLLA